ncbi:MAG: DUF4352 domain-containing protein [Chloroflexi bacterium]|nr:MAG: DUF4352 domain-containing protein [Chloroflexota bacterium]
MIYKKSFVLSGILIIPLLLLFTACGGDRSDSGGTNTAAGPGSTTVPVTITPEQVTPKTAQGTTGTGPFIIGTPMPVSGGKAGSQQVVLADRVLVINEASMQKGASAETTLVNLDLSVRNTSSNAIMNQSSFFALMGPEGDTFAYQYNSSDNFYGPIAANSTRNGMVVFQVPTAAATSLRLLYRPEVATETAILPLKT